jgi:hypothetical protein
VPVIPLDFNRTILFDDRTEIFAVLSVDALANVPLGAPFGFHAVLLSDADSPIAVPWISKAPGINRVPGNCHDLFAGALEFSVAGRWRVDHPYPFAALN